MYGIIRSKTLQTEKLADDVISKVFYQNTNSGTQGKKYVLPKITYI